MFRSKIRIHTFKVILITSILWFLVGVIVLTMYSDCISVSGHKCQQTQTELLGSSLFQVKSTEQLSLESLSTRTYRLNELKLWRPAKIIRGSEGSPGEMGKAVNIAPEQESIQQELFKLNQFNLLASDMITLNRSLRDVRLSACKNKKYPKLLPDTSVVIVFHNEAWSTLLRTVWSVINRSPTALLKEIILVDDASDRGNVLLAVIFNIFKFIYFTCLIQSSFRSSEAKT